MDDEKKIRERKYRSVKEHEKMKDHASYQAHLGHMKEMSAEKVRKSLVMEKEAKESHARCHRDMNAIQKRRESLKNQLNIEAEASMIHLKQLNQHIESKRIFHQGSIKHMKEKLQDKFGRDNEIWDEHVDIDSKTLYMHSKKVLEKNNLINRKIRNFSKQIDNKGQQLKDDNDTRFAVRDRNYSNVNAEKCQKDKATIERASFKDRIAESLLADRNNKHEAHVEVNRMRHSDAKETIQANLRKKQEFQSLVFKKQFHDNAYNQEASIVANNIVNDLKIGNQHDEVRLT